MLRNLFSPATFPQNDFCGWFFYFPNFQRTRKSQNHPFCYIKKNLYRFQILIDRLRLKEHVGMLLSQCHWPGIGVKYMMVVTTEARPTKTAVLRRNVFPSAIMLRGPHTRNLLPAANLPQHWAGPASASVSERRGGGGGGGGGAPHLGRDRILIHKYVPLHYVMNLTVQTYVVHKKSALAAASFARNYSYHELIYYELRALICEYCNYCKLSKRLTKETGEVNITCPEPV